ncbi:MAG: CBS domain-containing protein [Gammaproteobacteria bacterium]|nr:CBS domain-containing protein [Gammaproteobacteria bacterium]
MLKDIPVKNYMSQYVLTFTPEQEVLEAAKMLADRGIHSAPVMDNIGNLVGVLSDTDCMAVAIKVGYEPDFKGLVKEYMSDNVVTVEANESVLKIAEKFLKERYRRYPVMEDNRMIGQVDRLDVLRALEEMQR